MKDPNLRPDCDDPEMKDPNLRPYPGWHSSSRYWIDNFYNERGQVYEEFRRRGIRRLMRLEHIRFTQSSCSDRFRDGRRIERLEQALREAGSDEPWRLARARIKVVLFKGRYWSLDNRRLYCMKRTLPQDALIEVDYFSQIGFLGENPEMNEFVNKFTNDFEGLKIRVLLSLTRGRNILSGSKSLYKELQP